MKGIRQLIAIMIIAVASSCSSTHNAASTPQDDVYYSKGDAPESPSPAVSHPSPSNRGSENSYDQSQNSQGSQQQDNSQDYYRGPDSTSTGTQNQNANTINNYYNSDHYDYAYSARIRRYYDPLYGYGYYDPYYTNSYMYDYNPASYGSSIYLGYNFWGPSISIGIGFGWGYPSYGYGYGYPYYGYGYPYYGYPYYGYGYPYYGYGNPYCGYYNPYYYNSYDANSSYSYGPRSSISSTGRSATPPRTLGERYQQAQADGRISSSTQGGTRSGSGGIPPVRKSIESNPVSAQGPSTRDAGSAGGTTRGATPVKSATPEATSGLGGETPARTNGIISEKNQSGGTRVGGSTRDGGTPAGNHLQQVFTNPQPERTIAQSSPKVSTDKGGDVRPSNNGNISGSQHLPSRGSGQPGNNSVQGLGRNNGGASQPNPRVPSQGNNSWNQRGNIFNRNQNSGSSNPRSNDRPRMYQQPQQGFDQRQSSPQPHQQQPSFSQPSRGAAPSGGGSNPGGGGGRSGGNSGSGRSGGGRK